MRILLIGNNGHGMYQFRKELIEKFIDKSNIVLFTVPKDEYVTKIKELGSEYIELEYNRRGKNPINDFKVFVKYLTIIKQWHPNIVFSYTIKPNVYGGLACRLCNVPYIANITGLGTSIVNPGAMRIIALLLYKIGLKKAKCVFFQNRPNREFFKKYVLSSNARTRIIPGSGVNLTEHRYEPYPSESDGLRFLFAGRIMKDKGVNELFEAAKKVKADHPSTRFRLIGECDEDYDGIIDELKASGVIEPLGFQNDVHSFIKDSHCTILPSYHEGTANVLLESAACGRPVIASNVAGCTETFDDGVTGLGCEVQNTYDLILKIEQFINMSEAEHEAMGRAGRAKMEREYDRKTVIDAYLDEVSTVN